MRGQTQPHKQTSSGRALVVETPSCIEIRCERGHLLVKLMRAGHLEFKCKDRDYVRLEVADVIDALTKKRA